MRECGACVSLLRAHCPTDIICSCIRHILSVEYTVWDSACSAHASGSVVYDPEHVLSADKTKYVAKQAVSPTELAAPGLPFSLVFRAEPGAEDKILKVASAYEAATCRRVPPPDFGPL